MPPGSRIIISPVETVTLFVKTTVALFPLTVKLDIKVSSGIIAPMLSDVNTIPSTRSSTSLLVAKSIIIVLVSTYVWNEVAVNWFKEKPYLVLQFTL